MGFLTQIRFSGRAVHPPVFLHRSTIALVGQRAELPARPYAGAGAFGAGHGSSSNHACFGRRCAPVGCRPCVVSVLRTCFLSVRRARA